MSTPSPGPANLQRIVEAVGGVTAVSALLIALLYYFGWARTAALYGYFGVDTGVLGYSTNDYLLRSSHAAFSAIAVLLLIGTGALIGHLAVKQLLYRMSAREAQAVLWLIGAIGVGLLACGLVGLAGSLTLSASQLFNPIALGAGSALLEYAVSSGSARRIAAGQTPLMTAGLTLIRRGLAFGLIVLATFWTISIYAGEEGRQTAKDIENHPDSRPAAVVYSRSNLHLIQQFGVFRQPLGGKAAIYLYRYEGLRLLAHTNNRWILVPVEWTHTNGATVVLLLDNAEIRVDVQPSAS